MKLEYVYGSAHCYISDYNNGSLDNTDFLTPEFGADFKPIGAGKESEAVFRVTLSEIDDVTQTEPETTAQTTAGNAETAPPLNEVETTTSGSEVTISTTVETDNNSDATPETESEVDLDQDPDEATSEDISVGDVILLIVLVAACLAILFVVFGS